MMDDMGDEDLDDMTERQFDRAFAEGIPVDLATSREEYMRAATHVAAGSVNRGGSTFELAFAATWPGSSALAASA